MSETEIQSAIIDYLHLRKKFVIRLNNIPPTQLVNGQRVFRRMPKGSVKGLPDLVVLVEGGFGVWLEVKAPKGKQSPDQKEFEKRIKSLGGEYYIIRDVSDLKEIGL